jgi:hypothetical protein
MEPEPAPFVFWRFSTLAIGLDTFPSRHATYRAVRPLRPAPRCGNAAICQPLGNALGAQTFVAHTLDAVDDIAGYLAGSAKRLVRVLAASAGQPSLCALANAFPFLLRECKFDGQLQRAPRLSR